jgi:hypothetical protein
MSAKKHRREIEVTPEMIEAGERELASFDDRYSSLADGVEMIFRAMVSVKKSAKKSAKKSSEPKRATVS